MEFRLIDNFDEKLTKNKVQKRTTPRILKISGNFFFACDREENLALFLCNLVAPF